MPYGDNFAGPRDCDPRYIRLADPLDAGAVKWYDAVADRTGYWACDSGSVSRTVWDNYAAWEDWRFVPYPAGSWDDQYVRQTLAEEIARAREGGG